MDAVAAEAVKIRARFERALKAYEKAIKAHAETAEGDPFAKREACYRAYDKLRAVLPDYGADGVELARIDAFGPALMAAKDEAREVRLAKLRGRIKACEDIARIEKRARHY